MRRALSGWKLDRDQVRLAVAPTIPHHCSDEFIRACVALAAEHGVGLHTHVAESKVQAIVGLQRYGKTLTAHLDDLGVIGERFTVAHGVWLDEDDMRRLGDRGASVAHNPGSNMRLGNGLADMRAMLERRVNVGIGTDGANCSDNLNMYESMRLASFVSKAQRPDVERWVTTDEVALAATEGSARALGFDGLIGRLAPGYKADIVFLDLGHVNWIPLNDPTNQLVHTEDAGAVTHVMIGGRMVVRDRRLTTIDVAALAREAEAARERLARLNAPGKELYERLATVVGRFCPGLAHTPYHVTRYVGRY
jgi:guanine deaminase